MGSPFIKSLSRCGLCRVGICVVGGKCNGWGVSCWALCVQQGS